MSGGGGIIIITGKHSDGSSGTTQNFSASTIKTLWDAIPESARTGSAWSQVETIINDAINGP